MKAYYLDDQSNIATESLAAEGILYWQMPTTETQWQAPLGRIREERGYVEMDQIHLDKETPGLDALCDKFYAEHHHSDEEIRFVIGGSGIFDLRDEADRWMRVEVKAGDLIIVPAGKHHRFTLDDDRTITCKRLFKDTLGWRPIPRIES